MAPTPDEENNDESGQWRNFWRPLLAITCLILGSGMFAGITARFIVSHLYLYPKPRLGLLGQSGIALAFLAIGWLIGLSDSAPPRLFFGFYFLVVGAMLISRSFSAAILAHGVGTTELALLGSGIVLAAIGILLANTRERRRDQASDAV